MSRHIIRARSLPRIRAIDRRRAAIHEAGHAVMAAHLGYTAESWIFACRADGDCDFTFLGKTSFERAALDSSDHARLIGVAGMVAEWLWRLWVDGHIEEYADVIRDLLHDPDCMSETDWALTGCAAGEPDDELNAAAEDMSGLLIGLHWQTIKSFGRLLMDQRRHFLVPHMLTISQTSKPKNQAQPWRKSAAQEAARAAA